VRGCLLAPRRELSAVEVKASTAAARHLSRPRAPPLAAASPRAALLQSAACHALRLGATPVERAAAADLTLAGWRLLCASAAGDQRVLQRAPALHAPTRACPRCRRCCPQIRSWGEVSLRFEAFLAPLAMRGLGQAGRRAEQPHLKPFVALPPCASDDLSRGTPPPSTHCSVSSRSLTPRCRPT
jgi:hypothetical protein